MVNNLIVHLGFCDSVYIVVQKLIPHRRFVCFPLAIREAMNPEAMSNAIKSAASKVTASVNGSISSPYSGTGL
jgi:hypothetical protein